MSRSTRRSAISLWMFSLTTLLALSGCATICDIAGKQRIFGGTRFIAAQVEEPCILGPCASCGPCWLWDLPLSLAADTVLLPFTVTVAITQNSEEGPAKNGKRASDQPADPLYDITPK